jgi:hypothetical protein
MHTGLETLTVTELRERLVKIETLGKATAAKLAAGNRGHVIGTKVERGRHVPCYSVESALNLQRHAYRQTLIELRYREANG